jgi:hypothetical protein
MPSSSSSSAPVPRRPRTAALVAAALVAVQSSLLASASGLLDDPIHGDGNAIQYLDGEGWTVSGLGRTGSPITIGARVPGDLLTDLQIPSVISGGIT